MVRINMDFGGAVRLKYVRAFFFFILIAFNYFRYLWPNPIWINHFYVFIHKLWRAQLENSFV